LNIAHAPELPVIHAWQTNAIQQLRRGKHDDAHISKDAGLARGLRGGPVKEMSLSGFAARHAVEVIAGVPQKFGAREVVRRARSRLGEDRYRLLTNNCEYFCEWDLQGERRSYQIEACLEFPSRALLATERLMISIGECVSAFGKGVLKGGIR
jgi:hypothetical protein